MSDEREMSDKLADDMLKIVEYTGNDIQGFNRFIEAAKVCGYELVRNGEPLRSERPSSEALEALHALFGEEHGIAVEVGGYGEDAGAKGSVWITIDQILPAEVLKTIRQALQSPQQAGDVGSFLDDRLEKIEGTIKSYEEKGEEEAATSERCAWHEVMHIKDHLTQNGLLNTEGKDDTTT